MICASLRLLRCLDDTANGLLRFGRAGGSKEMLRPGSALRVCRATAICSSIVMAALGSRRIGEGLWSSSERLNEDLRVSLSVCSVSELCENSSSIGPMFDS